MKRTQLRHPAPPADSKLEAALGMSDAGRNRNASRKLDLPEAFGPTQKDPTLQTYVNA